MSVLFNPTGCGVRSDSVGDGKFGAPRGERTHRGTDLICIPGQPVYAPDDGTVMRMAYPYGQDLSWHGIFISGNVYAFKMFYMSPTEVDIGVKVKRGQQLGIAQDIGKKYPGAIPHVHFEVIMLPFTCMYKDGTWNQKEIWINPAPLIGIPG